MRDLTPAECGELLSRNRLCVLALTEGEDPYAIPLFYGYDGDALYFGISEGTKTRILDGNASVCASVTEVGSDESWRSVLVFGSARIVEEAGERQEAVRVLMEHNRRYRASAGIPSPARQGDAPAGQPQRAHGSGRIYVLRGTRTTGKSRD
jgi:nitroimidazol reductase NimA-like FMN-containing flavoprotein (pyridoxamine 5'-phosphate oxidase superfamily)